MTEVRVIFFLKIFLQLAFVSLLIFFIHVNYQEWYDVKFQGKAELYDIDCDYPAGDLNAYTCEDNFIRLRQIGFISYAITLFVFLIAFIFKWQLVKYACGAFFILIYCSLAI